MSDDYPKDADGDLLRGLLETGSDMNHPMMIDYSIDVPDEATARRVAAAVAAAGYDPSIYEDSDRRTWNVYCAKSMLATHEAVVAAKAQLNAIAEPMGAACDGWASFGNSKD